MIMSRNADWKFRQKNFNVGLIPHLISGKVTKLLVDKFPISAVMSQKPQGRGGKHTNSAFRVKILLLLLPAIQTNCNKLIV